MAILKCKMCGGDVQATDSTYGTCGSCGVTSTLPRSNDEKIVNLFNRANHFRRLGEFDKALDAYEKILDEDNANAEAHWCAVLCRYGIEYVEDPRTHERVPTCQRAQYEPVLSDPNYIAVLEHAPDEYTKSLYEEEAKRISEIQKRILSISGKEEPYDVFICYKEATDSGSRTKDSTIAQDIYYQLVGDGYRVFFSRITLEDKLGHEYEPYIFAALNSAKVMLVIGTKPEYFNAAWVKNEWMRFLSLMKTDRSRLLIPCYRDMDPYDIPDELSALQSQDMSKVGFIQDILRGVKKVVDAGKTADDVAPSSVATAAQNNEEPLLKRAYLFLEDGDFEHADEYFERVLDVNPENAKAYIGKVCVDLELKQEDDLLHQKSIEFTRSKNYQKALRFADSIYLTKLKKYEEGVLKYIHDKEQQEKNRQQELVYLNQKLKEKREADISKFKNETASKYESDLNKWQKTVDSIQEQANHWKCQGLCPHCGGRIRWITQLCKVCERSPDSPIKLPGKPIPPTCVSDNADWLILDKKDDNILLLSKYIVKRSLYQSSIWELSIVREYLNKRYINELGSEKDFIVTTELDNNGNRYYGTSGGHPTLDSVFVLSIEEVINYLGDYEQYIKQPSHIIDDKFNSARIATDSNGEATVWWLRSPGKDGGHAAVVNLVPCVN